MVGSQAGRLKPASCRAWLSTESANQASALRCIGMLYAACARAELASAPLLRVVTGELSYPGALSTRKAATHLPACSCVYACWQVDEVQGHLPVPGRGNMRGGRHVPGEVPGQDQHGRADQVHPCGADEGHEAGVWRRHGMSLPSPCNQHKRARRAGSLPGWKSGVIALGCGT